MMLKKSSSKLTIIKLIHTAIWGFFNVVIFYLLYAAVFANKIDTSIWICIGLILLEGIVLLIFKGKCPLTVMARRYSSSASANFDIFLPVWLAKYNKPIYTIIFVISIIIMVYRMAI